MKRRQFLQSVAHGGAVLSLGAGARAGQPGPNDRIGIGLIGCGGRGRFVARHMRNVAGVDFVAVCDVYERNMASAQEWAGGGGGGGGGGCRAYGDFRKLLEQRDVDAVLIATPDHWHAIPTIMACEAGKDVYVEKPLGHNIREGQAMVRAARKHDRVVQTGTQQRSAPHFDQMRQIVQNGELGDVHFVRIWNYRNMAPDGIGRRADGEPPDGLDWDFYLGPAPKVPFNANRFLGRFRYFWDYAGGIITDWGTHRFDSMHQVMGVDAPRSVAASGGRFVLDDGAEVPDIMQVTFEYPGFVVSYEACALNAHGCGGRTQGRRYYGAVGPEDRPNGLAFYGTNGAMFADRLGFEIYPELKPGVRLRRGADSAIAAESFRMQRREGFTPDSTPQHVADFIECVRTRRQPAADVQIGHRSSIVPHLGNIAYKTGQKLRWDAEREELVGESAASQLLGREARAPWNLLK